MGRLTLVRPPGEDEEPQGCLDALKSMGLAAYVLLVLGFLCVTVLCSFGSLAGIAYNSAYQPRALVGGPQLELWRWAPLHQQWDVLTPDERPVLYHDHSRKGDGSSGCVVVGGELVRWDDKAPTARMAIQGGQVVVEGDPEEPTVVLVQGEQRLACPFGEDEGGDRFERMLSSEAALRR